MPELRKLIKLDLRTTAKPHTVVVYTRNVYPDPENALRGWRKDFCGLRGTQLKQLSRFSDLVLVLRQAEERANKGYVDILSIDLRDSELSLLLAMRL